MSVAIPASAAICSQVVSPVSGPEAPLTLIGWQRITRVIVNVERAQSRLRQKTCRGRITTSCLRPVAPLKERQAEPLGSLDHHTLPSAQQPSKLRASGSDNPQAPVSLLRLHRTVGGWRIPSCHRHTAPPVPDWVEPMDLLRSASRPTLCCEPDVSATVEEGTGCSNTGADFFHNVSSHYPWRGHGGGTAILDPQCQGKDGAMRLS